MALVRVYCGVVTAEMPPWLTVAVVDDAGRLLDMRHISDDPAGYAYLTALLADRSGGAAPVAVDSHEHLVAQLLAAASRPVAVADEMALMDFAERFSDDTSYDEVQAPVTQRRAVGLARALQAGALYATAQSPSWDLDELKPLLAAHGAVTAGRQAAAAALRDVLRELYPAALRAYPDPAEYIPLTILDALPEPGLLTPSPSSRNRDAGLVADLSASGLTDATTASNAITALRVAVEESPRWNSNRLLAPVVAETVRHAVAAVRACDGASAALVGSLVERLAALSTSTAARPYLVAPMPSAPVSPAIPRPGPAAEVPPSRLAPRSSTASAAAAGVAGVAAGAAMAASGLAGTGSVGSVTIPSPRTEPSFAGSTFGDPRLTDPGHVGQGYPDQGGNEYAAAPARSYSGSHGYDYPGGPTDQPTPPYAAPAPYAPPQVPEYGPSAYEPAMAAPPYTFPDSTATTLSFAMDPLNAPLEPPGHSPAAAPGSPATPPTGWQAPGPPPPSPLRLVENSFADPLTDPLPNQGPPPVLRVIDGGREAGAGQQPRDDDLLIFSQTSSAWFTKIDDVDIADAPPTWGHLADEGWRAAEQVARPAVGAETMAGLPRRVPQANLVPGSAQPSERALRIVRDARSIAAHTDGYFRGWRRGQEIGGFAVGQRDRAAWEFNREQRLRDGADQRARLP